MKGTIDQVEAFFAGITGVWGRTLAFFAASWLSFGFTVVCMAATWDWSSGFSFDVSIFDMWYLLPFAWTISLGAGFLKWWGILFVLYLGCALLGVLMMEADMFRTAMLLFVIQGWHTLLLAIAFGGFNIDWGFVGGEWHPLLSFMFLMHAYALWYLYSTWTKERREEMPP